MLKISKRNTGFTLAEVLITLAVIGVVAAISIPSLISNINDSRYKTAYRKAFSDYSNAFNLAKANNDLVEMVSHKDYDSNYSNFLAIKKYFSISKDCNWNITKVWDIQGEKLRSTPFGNSDGFVDAEGRVWVTRYYPTDINTAKNVILVDTNGMKSPNKFGKDRFPLIISSGKKDPDILWLNNWDIVGTGMPVKIEPFNDYLSAGDEICTTAPCYYKSWLK